MVRLTNGSITFLITIRDYLGFKNEPYSEDISRKFLGGFNDLSYDKKNNTYTAQKELIHHIYHILIYVDREARERKNRVVFIKEIDEKTSQEEIESYLKEAECDKPEVLRLDDDTLIAKNRIVVDANINYCAYRWEVERLNEDEEWQTVYSANNEECAVNWASSQKLPPESSRIALQYYDLPFHKETIHVLDPENWYEVDEVMER